MSHLVSRILLSILMFPLAAIFYIFVFVVSIDAMGRVSRYGNLREAFTFGLCSILTWILVTAYWCLLWRSSVKWNAARITDTAAAAALSLVAGGFAGLLCAVITGRRGGAGFGAFIGGILAIVLWLIATVFIWRETPAERAQRIARSGGLAIACPTCGYNLTGLTESRCPECGSKFTLNELLAAQPNNKVEIE